MQHLVGRRFRAKWYNKPEWIEGVIQSSHDTIYLCQNTYDGDPCRDRLGYSFSWNVASGSISDMAAASVYQFELIEEDPLEERKVYCEHCRSIVDEDDTYEVINGGRSFNVCESCTEHFHAYNGEYYTDDGLEYNDLVRMYDGEICHRFDDDIYYWDRDDQWHYEPEENYVRGYHSGGFYTVNLDNMNSKTKYRIGYEIEKEDRGVLESILINDFEYSCPNWRKEEDGSLDDDGFEIVSPILPFNVKSIEKYLATNSVLVKHINAEYSSNCGGHINVSHINMSGEKFFDTIKGYLPLLYSLYPSRTRISYCQGKNSSQLKNDRDKYQAVKIERNYVEFRVFAAVRNLDNLLWRTKLLRRMLTFPARTPEKAYMYIDQHFKQIFSEIYRTDFDTKFAALKKRFRDYALRYEGKDIPLSI